jgi:hypothetical protein
LLGLIPSTTQIEENWLESFVFAICGLGWPVEAQLWADFALETSLFCAHWQPLPAARSFVACGMSRDTYSVKPEFVLPDPEASKTRGVL